MALHEGNLVFSAKVSDPVPGKHALNTDHHIFKKRKDNVERQFRVGVKILMYFGLPILAKDANVHFSCMQIDAAIIFVLPVVKSHNLASFFSLCKLIVVVSIPYNIEIKGATSSKIFRVRMGP
jgi:hypothetical protein